MMKELHVALTRHRPSKLGGYNLNTEAYTKLKEDLKQYLRFQLKTNDVVVGHTGMALGADTIWGLALLETKQQFPSRIKIHAEIPFMEQPNAWYNNVDKNRWNQIREAADAESIYESNFAQLMAEKGNKIAGKILNDRNIGMVDHADILLAIHDGSKSGTKNAIDYARSKNKPIVNIDPKKYFK